MSCLVCLSVCRVQVGLMLENEGFFFFFFLGFFRGFALLGKFYRSPRVITFTEINPMILP